MGLAKIHYEIKHQRLVLLVETSINSFLPEKPPGILLATRVDDDPFLAECHTEFPFAGLTHPGCCSPATHPLDCSDRHRTPTYVR